MLDTYLCFEINASSLFLKTHIKNTTCDLHDEPRPQALPSGLCPPSASPCCANPRQVSLGLLVPLQREHKILRDRGTALAQSPVWRRYTKREPQSQPSLYEH